MPAITNASNVINSQRTKNCLNNNNRTCKPDISRDQCKTFYAATDVSISTDGIIFIPDLSDKLAPKQYSSSDEFGLWCKQSFHRCCLSTTYHPNKREMGSSPLLVTKVTV